MKLTHLPSKLEPSRGFGKLIFFIFSRFSRVKKLKCWPLDFPHHLRNWKLILWYYHFCGREADLARSWELAADLVWEGGSWSGFSLQGLGFLHVAKLITVRGAGEHWALSEVCTRFWWRFFGFLVRTHVKVEAWFRGVYQILMRIFAFLARLRTKFSESCRSMKIHYVPSTLGYLFPR